MARQKIDLTSFRRDLSIRNSFIWAGLFSLISGILLVVFYWKLPPQIPLFFSQVRGEQQLASKPFIIILPILSWTILFVHLAISWINFKTERILSRITAATSTFITFLILIALVHTIIIVI